MLVTITEVFHFTSFAKRYDSVCACSFPAFCSRAQNNSVDLYLWVHCLTIIVVLCTREQKRVLSNIDIGYERQS